MGKNIWNKQNIIDRIKDLYDNNDIKHLSFEKIYNQYDDIPSRDAIRRYFGSLINLLNECEIVTLQNKPEEYLLSEIRRFIKEFNRLPLALDFEGKNTYPSRKTYDKYFGSTNDAVIASGYGDCEFIKDGRKTTLNKEKLFDNMCIKERKIYLINEINDFVSKYNHVPTADELDKHESYHNRGIFESMFGKYNNALREAGVKLNQVSKYDDEFLKQEFLRFVKENNRIPTQLEFNNSEYPSFWCYQSRFGSWNKAVMAYGFEPYDAYKTYYLEDGEKCMSLYEYNISIWLKKNKIEYVRDIPYTQIHDSYEGKMDCDYKIIYNNKTYYVEMAGFYPRINCKPSNQEKYYAKKLHYKIRLLKESKVNFLIIYREDADEKPLEEIFDFLKIN